MLAQLWLNYNCKRLMLSHSRLHQSPPPQPRPCRLLPFTSPRGPIDRRGKSVAGSGEELQSPSAAMRRAETLSRQPGNIGAVAFSRTGDPAIGEFSDAVVLWQFGDVPNDLSGL